MQNQLQKYHTLMFVSILIGIGNYCNAQCEYQWRLYNFRPNHFDTYLLDRAGIGDVLVSDNGITVWMDTLYDEKQPVKFPMLQDRSIIYYYAPHHYNHIRISDAVSGKTLYKGKERALFGHSEFLNTDDFLVDVRMDEIVALSLNSKKVKKFPLYNSEIVGNDHDFVYIKLDSVEKWNDTLFDAGSVFRLDTNNIYPYENKQNLIRDLQNIAFVNSDYLVLDSLLEFGQHNCTNYFRCRSLILWRGDTISDYIFESEHQSDQAVFWQDDTLSINCIDTFYNYCGGKLISKICYRDSFDLPGIFAGHGFTFFAEKNYFEVYVGFGTDDQAGLDPADPTRSLNGVTVDSRQPYNLIMLVYDRKTFQFLGIPSILLANL